MGQKIYIGQNAENIKNVSIIVISSAIPEDNVELVAGALNKVPIVRRADMLAELMRFKKSISVGGSHGKTTTTSFISSLLEGAKLDPTVVNGGIIEAYGTNARLGKSDWMIVEADESDGTFIKLPSDSSDSTTLQLLLPNLAELLNEFNMPPFITVGSNFAFEKIPATREVVVVFPCDPATTIFFVNKTICASMSPLL